ncbi:hypothetical protein, partial [Pseudomonas protegens]|uniref:hypothetical protein n=1 Tax=Pseudomonas protegens TaxID=380021 RepID=UPI002778D930
PSYTELGGSAGCFSPGDQAGQAEFLACEKNTAKDITMAAVLLPLHRYGFLARATTAIASAIKAASPVS